MLKDDDKTQLSAFREKEEEDLAKILSEKYKIPYLDLSRITIELDALSVVGEEDARRAKLAVFQKTAKKIQVAILSPNPEETRALIKKFENDGYSASLYIVSEASLERAWKKYGEVVEYKEAVKGVVNIHSDKIEEALHASLSFEDLTGTINQEIEGGSKTRRVSEFLEILLAGGIGSGASDIHIEPEETRIRLRMRLDGVLHDITFFKTDIYNLLLSRIKLVSGLKLNVHDAAQDGRFSIKIKGVEIEVRTSIIPETYGESVVMRILNPESISVTFEELGIEAKAMRTLLKEISRPNGMVLTTGPTGSGKTTTLYAFLKKIYSPDIKIITLEDPVEYHLQGITQTQTNKEKGYTFASGLRSILRQDPDVIMVGEIRDTETAKIAVDAALTGHFVLSTLHTNNAAGAIPRLIDLGVNPATLAPALNAAIAQRLLRKLCEKCKKQRPATDTEKRTIENQFSLMPEEYKTRMPSGEILVWEAVGCQDCNKIGYKGRIGIYEIIIINEEIKKLIITNPDETKITDAWTKQGALSMSQDGVLKVISGVTSMDELGRVVDL